jgi:cupin fold WbuC family metalloprotein
MKTEIELIVPITYHQESEEVLYPKEALVTADQTDIKIFKQLSAHNLRKRIRLCTHIEQTDSLHEMLILHTKGTYVRPHKHPGKSESTHIIEGLVDLILFDERGRIERIIRMGDYASGRTFYFRMAAPIFHTLIIRSEVLVFHETTNGPFAKNTNIFAPWAPVDTDVDLINHFMVELEEKINLIV